MKLVPKRGSYYNYISRDPDSSSSGEHGLMAGKDIQRCGYFTFHSALSE